MKLNDYYKRKSSRTLNVLSTMFDLFVYSIIISCIWWILRMF